MLPTEKERVISSAIHGYVDGVIGAEITGWIANIARPDELEAFSIESNASTGERKFFRPHLYRPDVIQQVGVGGIFGFAIPLEHLPENWTDISIRDGSGNLLEKGKMILPERQSGGRRDGVSNIFLHIQKTAGTSLRAAFSRSVSAARQCFLYPQLPGLTMPQFHSLPLYQRRQFDLIAGHFYFGLDRLIAKSCRYFSVLREPSARLRSHYLHHKRAMELGSTSLPAEIPVEAIVNDGLSDEFDNYQVRIISGMPKKTIPFGKMSESELELAIFNLENFFGYVGLVEQMEQDAPVLLTRMNLPTQPIEHLNVGENAPSPRGATPDKIHWPAVEERNKYDYALYEMVRSGKVRAGRRM